MNNDFVTSQINRLIPPEIKNDQFYTAIQKIAREEDIKTVLEIGSSSGEGSTEALVTGLRENQNQPILFCLEVSKNRFNELIKRYENDDFVKCYNISSISQKDFPNEEEVIDFYNSTKTNLNFYPLEQIITWLKQDTDYIKNAEVPEEGIKKIKQEHNIDYFDLVLIDGSEFTGSAELEQVYGAKYICLDDINTFKNNSNLNRLSADSEYSLIEINYNVRNGYAIFKKKTTTLVKYTTIQQQVESIEGFMVPGQEEYLFNKVQSLPENAVIVEIGSYKGRSTVTMAYACVGTSRKIYCIDTWDGNDSDFPERDFFDIWQQNVLKNGLIQYVTPLRGHSHEILSGWNKLADGKAIDFIFIDGSHQYLDVLKDFELSFPLVKNGGWIALHDVVHTWPGSERVWHELAKTSLINHEYSSTLACGQKLNSFITSSQIKLPVHFFTIVLNGQPFIQYHIEILKQLPFKWHWHIVEGVADLKHDTAWSTQLGGLVTDQIHKNGLSHDGTTEYLDQIAQQYPDQVTIYRKPEGIFWDGKREMVNEPLFNIHEECLLWQIDVDELWTLEQICTARQMFIDNPDKTAAFYWCWYFVGENLIISTRNCYAENPSQEWLRTWRYKPGAVWVAHEPPILQEPLHNGQWRDISAVNPFTHQETEKLGLIFQHFAYVTKEQLQFKEQYYGYKNATFQWLQLQQQAKLPVFLREYFPWVRDETQVNSASLYGIVPIAQRELISNSWRFLQTDEVQQQIAQIKKPRPTILVDGVFFQLYQTGIARVWKSLLQEWVNNGFAQHIILLDRSGTAPKIPGIRYRTIPTYNYDNTDADREMLQQVCDEEGAELFISTYYTTPITTPSVFMAHDMIPEIFGWDLSNPMWREKHYGIKHAAAYIAVSENTARDFVKCFPDIALDSVKVARNGVDHSIFTVASQEKVLLFKNKYGIAKPYFILVGAGGDYKNSISFFQAFSQLPSSYGFDIVCTGSGGVLAPEWRSYTSGSVVHMLQLSDEELATAYSGAVALVYPSKYEGFGMPIIEAMACGCPVITCPNASIPEVAGKAAIYVNDNDVDGLVNALCEVQKPSLRKSLIVAGLEQVKEFSWSKMADSVSSVLIETSLQFLNLKEINLIIFPDWAQPEEVLALELQQVVKSLVNRPDSEYMTLLIDTSSSVDDYAELLLSAVSMNLLMQEDLDISEGLEISLVPQLGEMQWKALLPRIKARIVLEHENQQAITQVKAETLPCYELEKQGAEFFFT